ncbi:MAG: aldehyde dehydrogenase family protein [Polyangiales bacterium]
MARVDGARPAPRPRSRSPAATPPVRWKLRDLLWAQARHARTRRQRSPDHRRRRRRRPRGGRGAGRGLRLRRSGLHQGAARVRAQERHYERVRDALVEGAKKTPVGDPMDPATRCGPMIDEKAAKRVRQWLDEAEAAGATVLCGGAREGNKVTPAVVEGARAGMKVHDDEVFGPVVTVHTFDQIDEAITAVNAGRYGLQAGVFTASLDTARRAFWSLKVGGVIVNDAPTFRVDAMPYGGVKDSGAGREGVRYAMEELCERRLLALHGFGP